MSNPFKLRPGLQSDLPFIKSSWLQSYRESSKISYDLFNIYQNGLTEKILERSLTVVACNSEDDDLILGWICFEPAPKPVRLIFDHPTMRIVHYAYVKAIYRKLGVGKALYKACVQEPFVYTHRTEMMRKLPISGDYCPYLAFEEMRPCVKK